MKTKSKKILPLILCVAFLCRYGIVNILFPMDDNAPVYQEVHVPDSVFENKFYFEQLSEGEQLVYKELYQGLEEHAEEITVHSTDGELTGEILQQVVCDFPGMFWTQGSSNALAYEGSHVVVQPVYECTKEERVSKQAEIDTAVEAILAQVPAESTEYDKIKFLYEYLVNDVAYVEDAADNQNIYSTFVGKETVCAGYSKGYQYLLEKLGIQCIYVYGIANGESHAWNIVQCNGQMYCVDVTWADPLFTETEEPTYDDMMYDYLCCSKKTLSATHVEDSNYQYPECTAEDLDYYRMNQMYYETVDRTLLKDTLYAAVKAKDSKTIFKFSDEQLYTQARDLLINELIGDAADYLCQRYGLQQVECSYTELKELNRFVVFWNYE